MHKQIIARRRREVGASLLAGLVFATILASATFASSPPPLVWTTTTTDIYPPDVSWAPGGGTYVSSTFGAADRAALTHYDATGAEVWRRELAASTRGDTVTTDSLGNAYLAGEITIPRFGVDVFVRKYSPAGDNIWNSQFGSTIHDWPTGIAVDAAGNSYVSSSPWATNYGVPPAGTHSQLRRLNSSGTVDWLRSLNPLDGSYPGGSVPFWNQTVLSHDGHIYSAYTNYFLTAPNTTSHQSYLTKFTLDGTLLWTKPLAADQYPADIDVDSQNNLYLAAGIHLIKLDSDGNQLWKHTDNTWRLFSLVVGPQDQVFVGGDRELDPYLAAYNPSGDLQWNLQTPLPNGDWSTFYGLAVSGDQLVGAAQYTVGGELVGNRIQAYRIIPEPTGAAMAVAALALMACPRFRK